MYSSAWFITFLILLVIELFTINLVTIWFALGAFAALISTYITDSLIIQVIVFIVFSVLSLVFTKPLMKRFRGISIIPTNSDRVIGKVGDVIKNIDPDNYGEVKVLGSVWTACSKQTIKKGEKVKVVGIDGVKLIVEKESD